MSLILLPCRIYWMNDLVISGLLFLGDAAAWPQVRGAVIESCAASLVSTEAMLAEALANATAAQAPN